MDPDELLAFEGANAYSDNEQNGFSLVAGEDIQDKAQVFHQVTIQDANGYNSCVRYGSSVTKGRDRYIKMSD